MRAMGLMRLMRPMGPIGLIGLIGLVSLTGCYREPPLHLYWQVIRFPMVDVQLDLYWNYETNLGINYNWRDEWYYGWDDEDREIFGELEYGVPTRFFMRRYYTGRNYLGSRKYKRDEYLTDRSFRKMFEEWGFWDLLVWNDVETIDGVQSLHFSESDSLDKPITAYTNETMNMVRYHAPRFQHSFWEPEPLFSACEEGIDLNENLNGFEFEEESGMWVRKLRMYLEPITYIYLPQIILRHNNGRIVQVPGISNLSGMARSTSLNTGIAGTDAIAVNFQMRLKKDKDWKAGEKVDIVGGRLMTFGICGQNANRVSRAEENKDNEHHYMDVQMQFFNGMDSTFVFDVTNQVRRRYKGGVITIELDMDTIPIPRRKGGSGFDAVVKDLEDGGTWEFEM